jgi:hypothetical protein
MADLVKPGNLKPPALEDYGDFANSMAKAIEDELNALLSLDGLPTLPTTPITDREIRDRRRLFVAIARGVVRHLRDHGAAIDVQLPDATILHPTIHADGL